MITQLSQLTKFIDFDDFVTQATTEHLPLQTPLLQGAPPQQQIHLLQQASIQKQTSLSKDPLPPQDPLQLQNTLQQQLSTLQPHNPLHNLTPSADDKTHVNPGPLQRHSGHYQDTDYSPLKRPCLTSLQHTGETLWVLNLCGRPV